MIPIHIRHIDDAEGTEIDSFPPSEIKPLTRLLSSGVAVSEWTGNETSYESARYQYTHFVINDGKGYVEIVVA